VILAFLADKFNEHQSNKRQTKADIEKKNRQDEINIKKSHLRNLAKNEGEQTVLNIARGSMSTSNIHISEAQKKEIVDLFKEILGLADLKGVPMDDLLDVLQPDTLLGKLQAKKIQKHANQHDFLALKVLEG
jgi:hypothetical protein